MKRPVLLLLLLLPAVQLRAQTKKAEIGQQAPTIAFEAVEGSLAPDFYKGKLLVLEFWATWCAPCIANFPHYNTLVEKYAPKGVVFAAMTDEPAATMSRFFTRTKKPLLGLRLIDRHGETANSLGIGSIPTSVVIGADNRVKWLGEGYDLTEAMIDKIMRDEPIATAAARPVKPQNKPIASRATFAFAIAPADTAKAVTDVRYGGRNLQGLWLDRGILNEPLATILEQVTGYSAAARISTNDPERLKQAYDLYFRAGKDTAVYASYKNRFIPGQPQKNFILTLMTTALNMGIEVIRKPAPHYEVVIADPEKLRSFATMQSGHSSFSDDSFPAFEIVGYHLPDIVKNLEKSFKAVIVTKVTDSVQEYDLSLNLENVETLRRSLRFHGLELKEVNDNVERLEVIFR